MVRRPIVIVSINDTIGTIGTISLSLLSCPTTQLTDLHNIICHCVPHVVPCENAMNCVTCILLCVCFAVLCYDLCIKT